MGQPKSDTEKYERAATELRELIRDAHAATKDLRIAYKDLVDMVDGVKHRVQEVYDDEFAQLKEHLTNTVEQGTKQIRSEVGRVSNEIFNPSNDGNKLSLGDIITARKVIDSLLRHVAMTAIGGEEQLDVVARRLAKLVANLKPGESENVEIEIPLP